MDNSLGGTYKERVGRYRVLRRTNYKPGSEHYVALVGEGIDPEDWWSLVWSSDELEYAESLADEHREIYSEPLFTVKVRDAGAPEIIERPIY